MDILERPMSDRCADNSFGKWFCCLLFFLFFGCSNAYYNALEFVGIPKRKLVVTRVKEAQTSQEEAKDQFLSALDKFKAVVAFDGGSLEDKYSELRGELEQSEKRAQAVKSHINSVEDVSEALFDEWGGELEQYSNAALRRESQRKLDETRRRYDKLIGAMRKAESRLDPVLQPLRDNVLFLKHNLNAQAIGSLSGELKEVETSVDQLVYDLENSIAEADRFVAEVERSNAESEGTANY